MPQVREAPVCDEQRDEVYKLWDSDAISGSDLAADKELQRVYRDLAERSLYFYAKGILGYADINERTHKEFCEKVQDLSIRFFLGLLPRGCFKTTIGTKAFGLQFITKFPEKSVLISNQVERNAQLMLSEMEGHVDGGNSRVNWLWPQMIRTSAKHKPWNSSQMRLPNNNSLMVPLNLMALGVGGKAESLHFHIIIKDDLIGQQAMASQLEMMTTVVWDDYATSLFVSPATGIERIYGTRYDLADLYALKLRDPRYEVFIRKAIDPETGEAFFPEFLPLEELRRIRERNYAHYMSQYMNDPDNPEVLEFRENWLSKFDLLKTEEGPACECDGMRYFVKDMYVIMVVDPAGSGDVDTNLTKELKRGRARKSDNAVIVLGLHGSGKYFLLDLWTGRGKGENPELQVAEQMLRMARAWHGYASKGFVEAYGAQRGLITVFNMLCRDNDFYFRMEEIPRGLQKAKQVRIRGAVGSAAQAGNLCVRRIQDRIIYEYCRFPQDPTTQDALDALAWGIIMAERPRSEVEEKLAKLASVKRRASRLRVISRGGY